VLWRIHRVHHSDRACDATTALRFHPFEALAGMVWQVALVAALGAPAASVLVYEMLALSVGLFSHANVRLSPRIDAWLGWIVVTPDMHRVHHSTDAREANRNFGVVLACWDRALATFTGMPVHGDAMTFGVDALQDARASRLGWLLVSPLIGEAGLRGVAGAPLSDTRCPRGPFRGTRSTTSRGT
jgi:sterol desaturase/sphingolipid hydroxylase (fatty acid hydroxylase superfamily)